MIVDDRKRVLGKVISVAADRFVVELLGATDNFTVIGFDDVHYVASLGSFVMIPVQADYVVAEVVGLREREAPSGGTDRQPGRDLDKAASTKFIDLVPVGMLPRKGQGGFRFGVSVFPTLYSDVLYALDHELDRIFEIDDAEVPARKTSDAKLAEERVEDADPADQTSGTRLRALTIGKSSVFQGYEVKVGVDAFFGGHVAVLGNTGSGKSCTLAAIFQSLFEKPTEYAARGATLLVFDVNGEYSRAFASLPEAGRIGVHTLLVDGTCSEGRFTLPHWFLSLAEWELLLRASEKTQLPVLRTALGLTGLLAGNSASRDTIKQHFVAKCITECFRGSDDSSPVTHNHRIYSLLDRFGTDALDPKIMAKHKYNGKYGNFDPPASLDRFLEDVKKFIDDTIVLPSYRNDPFNFDDLGDCLEFAILYEESHGNKQIRDYCSQMLTRFTSLRDREDFAFLRSRKGDLGLRETAGGFLAELLGLELRGDKLVKKHQVVIIDLNGVEDEVVELITSVTSRMVFDCLRRAEPRNRFPVHLVLEEAHRYVSERPSSHAIDASRIFERIAKEGRKYGVFLTLASQRPSELSRTVLSQCSNFVVHRIQNPDDLSHIRQMTPFISDSVLKRLPSLPKQHALIFGNAVNIPTTFRVRDANPTPKSDDAKISEIWFVEDGRAVELDLLVPAVEEEMAW